ncbi:MAG: hypothetical protein JRJ70_10585 [Deltaproteobacteria bacterium]|nr:hypothetical protein [Deltaproteobacteria bacterium]
MKHVYWLTEEKEGELRAVLAERGIKLKKGKAVVCPGLDEITKIISVAPEVWRGTCKRQGSWYRKSARNGLYLIISSFDLEGFEPYREAIITRSDFILPRPASGDEKQEMVEDEEFRSSVPEEWYIVSDLEKRLWTRWARRLGSEDDWDTLFLTHTATHANFIKPRFFIQKDGHIIPYSIDRSANLCSCCLELFGVIGERWKKKLVSPCAGAVIFSRLEKDRYLLVERQ